MMINGLKEAFESDAVVQVLARMQLETNIHAGIVKGIENRPPAARQFAERLLDDAGRTLRPRVH